MGLMLQGKVRIIGGEWRSRQLRFLASPYIKPTPDRVRETLFNWLSPIIEGTYCLDLFAGSGALGFEALSRGATWVGFIESSYKTFHTLCQQIRTFKVSERSHVYHQSYHQTTQLQLIDKIPPGKLIDLIFLDPPFRKGLLEVSLQWLITQSFLSPEAYVYIECEHHSPLPEAFQSTFHLYKQKKAGQVYYSLWRRKQDAVPPDVSPAA
jgi:16S rRNA (guanine966-N2)-methyltransferase